MGPCAVNLYGLPRSFKASVMPSLVQNVVRPNLPHKCDYFVHFDNADADTFNGRSDRIGKINPTEILLLEDVLNSEYAKAGIPRPLVSYCNTTPAEFQRKYKNLLHRINTETNENGDPIFQAYHHESYTNKTIENIIKMWNSQQSVWNLMENNPAGKHYSRVAMLRNDVVYMTPIDIYETGNWTKQWDQDNSVSIIPHFARFPVNDRMIYGPYDAVKIWASGRFQRLDQHAAYIQQFSHMGDGLHSERFLLNTIFPAIRQTGVSVQGKEGLCFLRVRADHSVRFSDCGKLHVTKHNHVAVETMLNRPCTLNWTLAVEKNLVQLDCPLASERATSSVSARGSSKWQQGCDATLKKKRLTCSNEHASLVLAPHVLTN
uniref:Uncharacterized protein n=1 Tax=Entomoneis paludosa TaxID=265537 RepID=A0A7S2VA15_9STRA